MATSDAFRSQRLGMGVSEQLWLATNLYCSGRGVTGQLVAAESSVLVVAMKRTTVEWLATEIDRRISDGIGRNTGRPDGGIDMLQAPEGGWI